MSHYEWLEKNLTHFFLNVGMPSEAAEDLQGIILAHGDKCYQYRDDWESSGIPFYHGAALYLLTYIPPYSKEVRGTIHGWVDPSEWVIRNYYGGYFFVDDLPIV